MGESLSDKLRRIFDDLSRITNLWGMLPSSVQDYLRQKAIGLIVGLVAALAFGGWVLFYHLPPPLVVLLVACVFAVSLIIMNQIMMRQNLKLLRSRIEAREGPLPTLPEATPQQLAKTHISGVRFHISDLVRQGPLLNGRTIEGCQIYGPAVLCPISDFNLIECSFGGSLNHNAFFLEVVSGEEMVGVIGLERCTFRRCTMIGISLIGSHEQVLKWKEGFINYRQPGSAAT